MKKTKKLTLKQAKKKCWDAFSLYIRARDGYKCVLCGATKESGAIIQAGHVIPGRGNSVLFREDCCFAQCASCNWRHTRDQWPYYKWFIDNYGAEKLEYLQALKHSTQRYRSSDLEVMAENYEKRYKELEISIYH